MRFFSATPRFEFMGRRKLAVGISVVFLLAAVLSLGLRGLNLGLDFTGGAVIEVGYPAAVDLGQVREALNRAGYGEAVVQHFGTARDVLVRVAPREGVSTAEIGDEIVAVLRSASDGTVQMRRQEYVGPQVGEELREQGGIALLVALVGILIYVALRFEYRLALGSVAALGHDVLIVLGIFSLLQLEFDLTVLAALLAVIGYSLNDTIVVYDRIRENFRTMRKGGPIEVINTSLNQTLSRTVVTGLTTLLVLAALYVFGGELIRGFALALILGIIVGTYSSIYVASALALRLGVDRASLMPVKKEGTEAEGVEGQPAPGQRPKKPRSAARAEASKTTSAP